MGNGPRRRLAVSATGFSIVLCVVASVCALFAALIVAFGIHKLGPPLAWAFGALAAFFLAHAVP